MIILPTYDTIILPNTRIRFPKEAMNELNLAEITVNDKVVFIMRKEKSDQNDTNEINQFYPIGVSGTVISLETDGAISVETSERINIEDLDLSNNSVIGITRPDNYDLEESDVQKQFDRMKANMLQYVQKYQWGIAARGYILQWKTMDDVAVGMSPFFNLSNEEKYKILETDSVAERTKLIEQAVMEFMAVSEVSDEAEKGQRELNEKIYREDAIKKQIRLLQKQLDEMHPEIQTDLQKLEEKIENLGMNETARKEAEKILKRIRQQGENSHEYGMLYEYLEFVTSLEWKPLETAEIDLDKAEKILEEEHYGLKKVKKRILEQLAVMSLSKKQSGSILLFVGPPGTGKTSIGRSIAEALGRKYVRVSLGGIRDEAEIRGHRRTYIGAMPGRIMEGMKTSQVSNPVMVLDEIDKLTSGYGGDPASALLEVLDPEQNSTFTDHYMNVPYDLSNVLFICTANTLDTIPAPLRDRMEIISFTGYTPVEKFQIAKKHLFPKAKEKTGIVADNLKLTDGAIKSLISDYTMESGVRGLKKQLDSLCRAAAVKIVKGEKKKVSINEKQIADYLDRRPIHHEKLEESKEPGIVTGLAWTAAGGEILFIETMLTPGTGQVKITGQLGDVMKESAQIAVSLVKNMYADQAERFEKQDIHIHVPEGAVPKDGPSAGITLMTALASLVTGKTVDPKIAMTGEISLHGKVMPIGGLPEKLMAAQRAGVKTVLIPEDNVDDLKDVAKEVLRHLEIKPVKHLKDVLNLVSIDRNSRVC